MMDRVPGRKIGDKVLKERTGYIFYRFVMPAAAIVLFGLGVFLGKSRLFENALLDWFVRIVVCLWFCALYVRLSNFDEYRLYPNIKWTKEDVGAFEKYCYIAEGILFGVGCAVFTWWYFRAFLPFLSNAAPVMAIINGIIIAVPIVRRYWVLKL